MYVLPQTDQHLNLYFSKYDNTNPFDEVHENWYSITLTSKLKSAIIILIFFFQFQNGCKLLPLLLQARRYLQRSLCAPPVGFCRQRSEHTHEKWSSLQETERKRHLQHCIQLLWKQIALDREHG